MDIESKIWNYTNTGTKVHAFINGTALCRKSITRTGADNNALTYCEAKGDRLCATCDKKFNAAIERAEDSMKPSTGEGDYLPPSENLYETKENNVTESKITPEMIAALRTLRTNVRSDEMSDRVAQALVILDNAGIFREIDAANNYDIAPAPVRVSKCTCVSPPLFDNHRPGCPGDPAEWGDAARTTVQVGSDEWHRLMGAALAETPLYALRKTDPAEEAEIGLPSLAPGQRITPSFSDNHPSAAAKLAALIKEEN